MTMRKCVNSLLVAAALAFTAGCGESESAKPAEKPAAPAKTPLVQTKQAADWCKEHGVPESICTRCNDSLVAGFKAKGDWCKEHGLPESQCFACHPELEAKFKASMPAGADK
ncbi:MAG: hypothetical protein HMLKMBBP_01320 [Planctomycetes bacterium]|nr:hypothetical protein [Planctomycetota bacterium]